MKHLLRDETVDQFPPVELGGKTILKEKESGSKLKVAVVKRTGCHELVTPL